MRQSYAQQGLQGEFCWPKIITPQQLVHIGCKNIYPRESDSWSQVTLPEPPALRIALSSADTQCWLLLRNFSVPKEIKEEIIGIKGWGTSDALLSRESVKTTGSSKNDWMKSTDGLILR